jgi:eukaryotic-like serine/threonine-protein kinase
LRVTARDWQRLSPLVDQALDIAAGERRKWVNSLADLTPELREKLLSLVAKHGAPETRNFLETLPSFGETNIVETKPGDWSTDDVIGNYTLIRRIGQGGMGEVWLAKRSDGAYQRNVALKLPCADGVPARIRERMLRERDVLASLEHANIARFYDASVTASGQPFLAMEFVAGDTLTAYADAKKLTTRDRCKLFLQVLAAVQFAHQRLVVHRDLKPSNIMVRTNGDVALLDFGIAKVLDETSHLGTESQLTRETGRALTLAYAAPEQVLSEPISTATDIFAAGVLFYELLSGARPFAAHERNMSAMIKAYDAPLKPLPKALSRDLNAIVARALRREPNDRYESAAAFADDIKRYLDDQPVVAVQGARWYSFTKFVKRQRVAIGVATLGLAGATALTVTALTQREIGKTSILHAETVEKLFGGLLDGVDPELAKNRTFTVKEILDEATRSLDVSRLSSRQLELVLRLADLYDTVGDTQTSIRLLNEYLRTTRDLKDVESEVLVLAELVLDYIKVEDIFRSRQTMSELIARSADNTSPRSKLALAHARMELANASEDYALAVSIFNEVRGTLIQPDRSEPLALAQIYQAHGFALESLDQLEAAEKSFLTAGDFYGHAGLKGVMLKHLMSVKLAEILFRRGKYDAALENVRSALQVFEARLPETHRFLLSAHYANTSALTFSGKLELARVAADAYVKAARESEAHSILAHRLSLRIRSYSGDCAGVLGALAASSQSANSSGNRSATPTSVLKLRRLRAECYLRTGDYNSAAMELESILGSADNSELGIAYTRAMLAIARIKGNRLEEARALFSRAIGPIEKLSGSHDSAFVASRAYMALLNDSVDLAERQEIARAVQHYVGWQEGASTLQDLLMGVATRERPTDWPVIF